MLKIALLCASLVLASPATFAREAATRDPVARAHELLRSWQGDSRKLDDARALLARELEAHPRSAPALREQARLLMLEGYRSGTEYAPESLAAAAKALDESLAIAPNDPVALLLRARIDTNRGRFEDAWAALEAARRARADDREWLLAQASLLNRQQRFEESSASNVTLLKRSGTTPYQRLEARTGLIHALLVGKNADEADKVYRDQIKDMPNDAWTQGNYASFLLCWRDDAETSLVHARTARRLMDHGKAEGIELAALFRLWAQQTLDGKAADAEKTWKRTGAGPQADVVPVVQGFCGDSRVIYAVLKAMMASGLGARVPALVAPLLAAEKAPDPVPGVFALNVQASGRSKGDVFLNSETDYRDARNLSVRILPEAQAELREKYGDDFEAALKGRPVEVVGWIRRERIDFWTDGKRTGKFYYQTHIILYSADQILRLEDRPARSESHAKADGRDA